MLIDRRWNNKEKNYKITLKTNCFSPYIEKKDFIKQFNKEKTWNVHDLTKKIKKYKHIDNNVCGVYILYNQKKEPIYIGKSINIRSRLFQHLIYITSEYQLEKENIKNIEKEKECFYIRFIKEEKSNYDALEVVLINMFRPKYNIEFKK